MLFHVGFGFIGGLWSSEGCSLTKHSPKNNVATQRGIFPDSCSCRWIGDYDEKLARKDYLFIYCIEPWVEMRASSYESRLSNFVRATPDLGSLHPFREVCSEEGTEAQGRKNNTNINFWSGFPGTFLTLTAGCPGQKVSSHHQGPRKTHILVRTSTTSG